MAAPSGTAWGNIVGGYGRIGIYVGVSSTNTQTKMDVQIWFWSKYSVSDTSNTYYYDSGKTSATTSRGSVSIRTTVDSGGGWSTSNQVRLGRYSYTYNRGTSNVTKYFCAKLTGIDRVGGTMTMSKTGTVPKKASYTVSYNANGGSGAPGSQTKWYGSNLTLSGTRPTRTGYSFAGWATSSSGSVAYQPGSTYSSNSSVTLYAKWTANTYKVSFNPNGGSGGPSYQTKTYGVNLTLSTSKPTRTNYNFLGWGTSSGATSASYQPGGTYTSNSAITLYAVWQLAYKAPRISSFSAQRCNSAGTASESGTYAKVTFSWATDRTVSGITIQWRLQSSSTWTSASVTASGTSGSVSQVVGSGGISSESSYIVRAYVSDSGGTTYSSQVSIGTVKFPIDVKSGGTGIAFGKVAETANMADFGWIARFTKGIQKYGDNTIATTSADTPANWGNYPNTLHFYSQTGLLTNQPSQWGFLLNLGHSSEIHQLWMTQASGDLAHRGGNSSGWNGSWRRILDTSNYSSYALPKSGGTLSGSLQIGTGNSHSLYTDQWLGWYRSSDGARVGWMGANSTNDMYFSAERGSFRFTGGKIIIPNTGGSYTGGLHALRTDGNWTYLIGLSSGNNLNVGTGSLDNYAYGNTNIYSLRGYITLAVDTSGSGQIRLTDRDDQYGAFFSPVSNGYICLGNSNNRFFGVYLSHSPNVSSDKRIKNNIIPISKGLKSRENIFEQLFDLLKPVSFSLNNDKSNKTHIGFVAQDVSNALSSLGVKEDNFELIDHMFFTDEETGEEKDEYGLRYEEFIALNTHMIQKANTTIQSQQKEIDDLKKQVQDLQELVLSA